MAGPVRYLSGRQNSVKIGIPDYRTEDTSLVVLGRVGIGTTNATSDLYVKGGGEFTGVVTATKFDGAFENITLTGVTTTQQFNTTIIETETINITGISTFGDIVNLIGSTAGVTSITFTPSTNSLEFKDTRGVTDDYYEVKTIASYQDGIFPPTSASAWGDYYDVTIGGGFEFGTIFNIDNVFSCQISIICFSKSFFRNKTISFLFLNVFIIINISLKI